MMNSNFDRLLDWEIGGLCAFEDFVHVSGGAPIEVGSIHSVRHEATGIDVHSTSG